MGKSSSSLPPKKEIAFPGVDFFAHLGPHALLLRDAVRVPA